MYFDLILWDPEDEQGNWTHTFGHEDVTPKEVTEVFHKAQKPFQKDKVKGRFQATEWVSTRRLIKVIFEIEDDFDLVLIRPITAWEKKD
jgi:hypothetical protein